MDNETYKSLICDSCKKCGTKECDENITSVVAPDGIETTKCESFDTNRKGLVW